MLSPQYYERPSNKDALPVFLPLQEHESSKGGKRPHEQCTHHPDAVTQGQVKLKEPFAVFISFEWVIRAEAVRGGEPGCDGQLVHIQHCSGTSDIVVTQRVAKLLT